MNTKSEPVEKLGIGGIIRRTRKASGRTMKDISDASGVSVANISKIETGKITGGFDTIYKIARGLGVLVTDIIPVDTTESDGLVFSKSEDADVHYTSFYDYFLQANHKNGTLNTYIMLIKNRLVPDRVDWSIHDGEEVIFILSGEIMLHIDDEEPCHLKQHDSACFDSGKRHAFVTISEETAQIISVSTRPPR
ncbi:cupin domain-containing protein [Rhodobacteraceae bacterium IMCC15231]|nr:cupin domain-containing protein [Rhodobacteraceae bacterium IMCC15231]